MAGISPLHQLCLAVIPARGGSKRVPQKNIRELCGKPIIAYSIEAALEGGIFARVIVSPDSDVIATIARHSGAEVPLLHDASLAWQATIRQFR